MRARAKWSGVFVGGAACFAVACLTVAQDGQESNVERQRRGEVSLLAPAKARQIEIFVGERPEKASLHAEPLLRWSNATAGSVYGEVFLWTSKSRPVAIASIFRWYSPYTDRTVEAVSVAPSPVQAREDGKLMWEAKSSGVAFKPLSGAPVPADSAGARLGQMRTLARRFSAELADLRGGEEVARQLRLLNQPVYRYTSDEHRVLDGALFALVEVTDPEAWIMLEAVKAEEGLVWRYALARMNSDAMKISLDGHETQHWPKIEDPWKNHEAPYTFIVFQAESVKLDKAGEKRE